MCIKSRLVTIERLISKLYLFEFETLVCYYGEINNIEINIFEFEILFDEDAKKLFGVTSNL